MAQMETMIFTTYLRYYIKTHAPWISFYEQEGSMQLPRVNLSLRV